MYHYRGCQCHCSPPNQELGIVSLSLSPETTRVLTSLNLTQVAAAAASSVVEGKPKALYPVCRRDKASASSSSLLLRRGLD